MEKLLPTTSTRRDSACVFTFLAAEEGRSQRILSPFCFSYSIGNTLGAAAVLRVSQHRPLSLIFSFISLRRLSFSPRCLPLSAMLHSASRSSPPPRQQLHITGTTIWLRIIDRLNRVCIQISNGVYVYVRVWVCVWGAAQEETQPPPRPDFPSFHAPSRLVGLEDLL